MNTFILKEADVDAYWKSTISTSSSIEESILNTTLFGLETLDIEEAKKKAEIGDCLLIQYENKLIPMQVIHKFDDGRVALQSYYLLDKHAFDKNTNVWRDAEIRKYMNEDMAAKFDPEFVKLVKPYQVHTDDYVTEDKFWLLSHEEIGYEDKNNMFKKNVGTITFDYYKDSSK